MDVSVSLVLYYTIVQVIYHQEDRIPNSLMQMNKKIKISEAF